MCIKAVKEGQSNLVFNTNAQWNVFQGSVSFVKNVGRQRDFANF